MKNTTGPFSTVFYAVAAVLLFLPAAQMAVYAREPMKIWFDRPAGSEDPRAYEKSYHLNGNPDPEWEARSLPIGNGSIGGCVMGSVAVDRIVLNEKSLWTGGPNTTGGAEYYWNVNKRSAHVLPEIRQALWDGDQAKAEKLTRENFNGYADYEPSREDPFRFGYYAALGEMRVETGIDESRISDYRNTLSLDSAYVSLGFRYDGALYTRDYFVSYPDSIMAVRFSADRPGTQTLSLGYNPNSVSTGSLSADGSGGIVYTGRLDANQMEFCVRIKALNRGGTVNFENGVLKITGADEVVFLLSADTDYRMNFDPDLADRKAYVGPDPRKTTAQNIANASIRGFDALFTRHLADYKSLYDRVSLTINPDGKVADMPTDVRLAAYKKGSKDHYLETLYFQYGRYLLIASSRPGSMPANLQGMWHNAVDGPWHVDYHNNINVQMNYWPALSGNLASCAVPLTDYIRSLEKPGEKTAQTYYDARGWTASISGNIFGFTAPMNSRDMGWNLIPVAGAWLAAHLWDYYDYTRDTDFLRETGYRLIASSADFVSDYLWLTPGGYYTAAPSTSPEHGPVDLGATFSHGVIKEILIAAIEAGRVLKTDKERRREWQHKLDNLAPYEIGRFGQLMEWSKDIDDPNDKHRHVNHLYALHPGHTISPLTTPALSEACRVTLDHRGDYSTGWSMGWKLNQWARLRDGNRCYALYTNLLSTGTTNNMWSYHPPFQIDGNFGGTAGVTEMLLQSHMGFIDLLPSLPDEWRDGSVSGICARGNFEVSLKWADSALTEAVVLSKSGGKCTVKYGDRSVTFKTSAGKTYKISCSNGRLSVM